MWNWNIRVPVTYAARARPSAVLPKCRRAHPGEPTELHDFPLLVDGRPIAGRHLTEADLRSMLH